MKRYLSQHLNASQMARLREHLESFINPVRLTKMQQVLSQRTRYLTIVLEDIYQSQNASAVLRSCECFGIQDVHIIENLYQYEVNPDVVRGASKWLDMHTYNESENNTLNCLNRLRESGYRIVATSPYKKGYTLEKLPLDKKTALVFGTEQHGISETVKKNADAFVRIPMRGFTESFNISVSAAIVLYHLSKRAREEGRHWMLENEELELLRIEWLLRSLKNPVQLLNHILKEFT